MKKLTVRHILCVLVLLTNNCYAQSEFSRVWETSTSFLAPESVVHDAKRNVLYVANYNNQGGFKRSDIGVANEFVSKLDMNGNLVEMKWITPLENPTGMYIHNDHLYIVERKGVVIVNLEKQTIDHRVSIPDAAFLNDIVVTATGTMYVSDSNNNRIYSVYQNTVDIWHTSDLISSPNGLCLDDNHLIIGNKGHGNLLAVSLADKSETIIGNEIARKIDGIQPYDGGYLLSWASKLHLLQDNEKALIYRAENKKDFLADFVFIESQNLLVIPKLVTGKIVAFRMK